MPVIERSALLPYPADKLYELINDINAYPKYLKGCVGAEVLRQDDQVVEARLDLKKGGIQQSFTTRNHLSPGKIDMELVNGPFDSFAGQWLVMALNESACKVSLTLSFTLSNKIVAVTAKTLFNPVADHLVDAIVKRANELYG
jgi:ribosome-associated toxin RatA of RatAB toxin-antitoxin module